jgi:hypothetical protein
VVGCGRGSLKVSGFHVGVDGLGGIVEFVEQPLLGDTLLAGRLISISTSSDGIVDIATHQTRLVGDKVRL